MSWKLGSKNISVIFGSGRKSRLTLHQWMITVSSLWIFPFLSLQHNMSDLCVLLQLCKNTPACGAVFICSCLTLAFGFRRFDDLEVCILQDVSQWPLPPDVRRLYLLFPHRASIGLCDLQRCGGVLLPRSDGRSLSLVSVVFLFSSLVDFLL